MTLLINPDPKWKTTELLARLLNHCACGERVQFLVAAGDGLKVVQRLRVALSRSRKRNEGRGVKVKRFTLRHTIYPYTTREGKRHDCIVVWVEQEIHHKSREILDDLMERES